jgi:hypothetical protein
MLLNLLIELTYENIFSKDFSEDEVNKFILTLVFLG